MRDQREDIDRCLHPHPAVPEGVQEFARLLLGRSVLKPEVFGEELLRDCLGSFPHVRLTVTGRCMEPALRHGERVHLVGATRRPPLRVGCRGARRPSRGDARPTRSLRRDA